MMKLTLNVVCFVIANALPHYALAQDSVPVETTLKAEVLEKIQLSDGRQSQRLIPAAVITQGDVVYYTVHVRNPTTVPARDVQVIQRIPENTRYVPNSASGPSVDITFSADGGQTFDSATRGPGTARSGFRWPAVDPSRAWQLRWPTVTRRSR